MRARAVLVSLSLALLHGGAARADDVSATAEADTYFKVGARAYQAGRFADAAEAFAKANERASTPGLLFSLGQANRMEFAARNDPARLSEAVRWYEACVKAAPQGKRANEAAEYLSRLRPQLAAMAGTASSVTLRPAKPRVMISSPTEGARIAFDDREVGEPYIAEVAPGKHRVSVYAPGYVRYDRVLEVDATAGAPPLDVELRPIPSQLLVEAPAGALVAIDGELRGEAPLRPLALSAGSHDIRVTTSGALPFEQSVVLARGATVTVRASLERSSQRKLAIATFSLAGGALAAGGAFVGWSLLNASEARSLYRDTQTLGNLPSSTLDRYHSLDDARQKHLERSIALMAAGGALGALGLTLVVFDRPPAVGAAPSSKEALPSETRANPSAPVELGFTPIVLPSGGGASLDLRF